MAGNLLLLFFCLYVFRLVKVKIKVAYSIDKNKDLVVRTLKGGSVSRGVTLIKEYQGCEALEIM